MPVKKYRVSLTQEERDYLESPQKPISNSSINTTTTHTMFKVSDMTHKNMVYQDKREENTNIQPIFRQKIPYLF